MRQGKSQPARRGAVTGPPASPDALREEAHPRAAENESKQPYASELDDYHGGKVKPPKESPTTADR